MKSKYCRHTNVKLKVRRTDCDLCITEDAEALELVAKGLSTKKRKKEKRRNMTDKVLVPVAYAWHDKCDESGLTPEMGQLVPISSGDSQTIRMWWECCLCSVSQALVGGRDWNHDPLEVFSDWFFGGYEAGPEGYDISHATPEILERVRFDFSSLTKAVHKLVEKHGAVMKYDTPYEVWGFMCAALHDNPRLLIRQEYRAPQVIKEKEDGEQLDRRFSPPITPLYGGDIIERWQDGDDDPQAAPVEAAKSN